jgi:hypothetical protein
MGLQGIFEQVQDIFRPVGEVPTSPHDEPGAIIHESKQVKLSQVPDEIPSLEIDLPQVVWKFSLEGNVIRVTVSAFLYQSRFPQVSPHGLDGGTIVSKFPFQEAVNGSG